MFPSKEIIERIRKEYPSGCRIVLDKMDDPQAPPVGTQGTVQFVDDAGTIWVAWDKRCGLGIAYGVDSCHKISNEDEAKTTVEWYGKHQPKTNAICPRCGELMPGKTTTHALSRWADIFVCDLCGGIEALEKAGIVPTRPLLEWSIIRS